MASFRMDRIIKAAHAQSWRVRETTKGYQFLPPRIDLGLVLTHKTPSDHQARMNFRRDMEKRGFKWPEGVK